MYKSTPRVNPRPRSRASNEIDVVPPEVFASFGGVRSQNQTKETGETLRSQHDNSNLENRRHEGPTLPKRAEIVPAQNSLCFHSKNDSCPVLNDGIENSGKVDEGIVIIVDTNVNQSSSTGESDQSHPVKFEFPPSSRRTMMNREMSEITLNASQHPEPKQMDDIVLIPGSHHKKSRQRRSPRSSPKEKIVVSSVLRQLYPDYDSSSQSTDKDLTASKTTAQSRQSSIIDNDDESFSSTGDYDGFEADSDDGNDDEEEVHREELTPLVEETSEELSGGFDKKKKRSSFRLSWISSSNDYQSDSPNKSTGKKFHARVPSLKRVSVFGGSFLSPTKRRDEPAVAAV